jgi:pyrroloquinoline quinone biosynthesis protein B
VLGSGAGGGLPQWNCGCANCVRARAGDPALPPRSQASLAVSADGRRWSLLGASPDVRQQLAAFPALHPRPGTRDLPLDTVVLTSADLDQALGLLVLREALSYRVVSTPWVREALLRHNSVFRLLEPVWSAAKLDATFALDREGRLEGRFFPAAGRVPPHLRGLEEAGPETTVGLRLSDAASGRRLVYLPGTARLDSAAWAELETAACVFLDGTFFGEDELRSVRAGAPPAREMGHLPVGGPDGSLERLAAHPGRRLYIHLNNTSPLLDARSPERAVLAARGVEVASDGLELEA